MEKDSKISLDRAKSSLWTRFRPIYDNTFDDLLAKLDEIELDREKKS